MSDSLKFLLEITLPAIIIIALLTIAASLLYNYVGKKDIEEHKVVFSNLEINIKEQMVKIINRNNREDVKEFKMDDFIYMISKNSSSKEFRELLKLINNKSKLSEIKKKILLVNNFSVFEISYSNKNKKVVHVFINREILDDNIINIQMTEYYSNPKQSFFEEIELNLKYMNDDEIFENVSKDLKNIRAKRWTLIKINFASTLNSQKEANIQKMQLDKIAAILKEQKIASYINKNNYIYAVSKTGRSSNPLAVWKQWNNYFNSLLSAKKKLDFLDVSFNDLELSTVNFNDKSVKTINEAFVMIGVISEIKNNGEWKSDSYDYATDKTREIVVNLSSIQKEINVNDKFLKNIEFEIRERAYKNIVEMFLNLNLQDSKELMKFSIYRRQEIIQNIFNECIKEAKKNPDKLITFIFDLHLLDAVLKVTKNIGKTPENFFVSFESSESETYQGLKESFAQLRDKHINLMQVVYHPNKMVAKFYREMEPNAIVFMKDYQNENFDDRNEAFLNKEYLLRNIDKSTKIYNIK